MFSIVFVMLVVSQPIDSELRDELRHRVQQDQEARRVLVAENFKSQRLRDRLAEIDKANTARLKQIVADHGWPGKTLVGAEGAHDAWLLVQHADRDREFQAKCLELLANAVARQEAEPVDFAFLTDRVRVARGEKQVYGTQFQGEGEAMKPYPIEDEANVDQRRKSVGLESLAEYAASIKQLDTPENTTRDTRLPSSEKSPHPKPR